jgi:hypothetical protein
MITMRKYWLFGGLTTMLLIVALDYFALPPRGTFGTLAFTLLLLFITFYLARSVAPTRHVARGGTARPGMPRPVLVRLADAARPRLTAPSLRYDRKQAARTAVARTPSGE